MPAGSSSYSNGLPFEAFYATWPDNKDADGQLPSESLFAAARSALFGPILVARVVRPAISTSAVRGRIPRADRRLSKASGDMKRDKAAN
jgi:hypothetical protein